MESSRSRARVSSEIEDGYKNAPSATQESCVSGYLHKDWCRRGDSASRVPPNTRLFCKVPSVYTLQEIGQNSSTV